MEVDNDAPPPGALAVVPAHQGLEGHPPPEEEAGDGDGDSDRASGGAFDDRAGDFPPEPDARLAAAEAQLRALADRVAAVRAAGARAGILPALTAEAATEAADRQRAAWFRFLIDLEGRARRGRAR